MTDDFQLFQDQADGDAVDADVALVTAYLARELSLVQVVAVEDRLAKDAAFREKVRPIIEAWIQTAPAGAVPAARLGDALSRAEVEAGWQRYVGEYADLGAHEAPRLVVEGAQPKRRKISMTRIAAGIAAITLPIVTLAQVVVYAAKHPDVPGHSVARQIVAPLREAPPAPPPKTQPPLTSPVDVPIGRQLEKGTPAVQRASGASAAVELPSATAGVPSQPALPAATPNPDRAKIAALASKHMPQVVRGDTAANYAVIVLDAAENYMWSTYGNGGSQIEVAGDARTARQRAEFNREHQIELLGAMPGARGGGGGGGARGGAGMAVGGGARGGGGGGGGGQLPDSVLARLRAAMTVVGGGAGGDSTVGYGRGRRGGGAGSSRGDSTVLRLDSNFRTQFRVGDTVKTLNIARGGTVVGGVGLAFTGFDSTGTYRVGNGPRMVDGQRASLNTASGLQEPGNGESGIQGLKSASITAGEQYLFAPGQLAPHALRIIVVHLAPGTNWKGR